MGEATRLSRSLVTRRGRLTGPDYFCCRIRGRQTNYVYVRVFNRPPPLLATAVVAAEQRAPGRFVLGLGPSTNNMVDRWYGLEYFREYIGFYGAAPAYQRIMIRLGYGKTVDAIRQGYAERNRIAVKQAVSDEMVTRLFAFGDTSRCQEIVLADFAAGVDSSVVSPQANQQTTIRDALKLLSPKVSNQL